VKVRGKVKARDREQELVAEATPARLPPIPLVQQARATPHQKESPFLNSKQKPSRKAPAKLKPWKISSNTLLPKKAKTARLTKLEKRQILKNSLTISMLKPRLLKAAEQIPLRPEIPPPSSASSQQPGSGAPGGSGSGESETPGGSGQEGQGQGSSGNGGSGGAGNISEFAENLGRTSDEQLELLASQLSDAPMDLPETIEALESAQQRLLVLLDEFIKENFPDNGEAKIPLIYKRTVDDYFRDLSDDFSDDENF